MITTFRGSTGLNYAKIRHSKKDNKSVIDLTKDLSKSELKNHITKDLAETTFDQITKQNPVPVFEEGMNKDNLNYINSLLKDQETKQSTRNKSLNLKNIANIPPATLLQQKKAQLTKKIEKLKPVISEEKIERYSTSKKDLKESTDIQSLENSQVIQKENVYEGNTLKCSDIIMNQKLFDQFFKYKNNSEGILSPSVHISNIVSPSSNIYNTNTKNDDKKNNNDNSSYNTQLSTKISNKNEVEFLKSIDEYLIHLDTNEKDVGTAYFSIESDKKTKEDIKEINNLKNENKALKIKLEKYELKIKENSSNKRIILQDLNHFKQKDEENHNLIKCLQQEIYKMKNYVENLKFKLKVTQESLVKEKIEAENSMIALKRVLYNNMNESRMEDKYKKMFLKAKEKKELEKNSEIDHNFYLNNYDINLKNNENKQFLNQNNITIEESNESLIGRSIESNIKSSYSQESFDDFNLYKMNEKNKKNLYDLQKKRKSMHSRYESSSNYNSAFNEQSFLRKVNKNEFKDHFFPQNNKYMPSLKKSHNNKEFKMEEESSTNELQMNSLSLQME